MGNCCHAETPCGSLEERSGLLKNDSKATVSTGEKVKEDTYCPDGDDDMRMINDDTNIKVDEKVEAVQANLSAENGEMELNYTQDDRPLMKESVQTAMASPYKQVTCKENATKVQDEDMKEHSNNREQTGLLQCTLNSKKKAHPAAPWEVFTESNLVPEEVKPPSVQDRISVNISPKAESASPEKPSHTETTSTTEHTTMQISHNDKEGEGSEVTSAAAEPSGEFSEQSEVSSVPNTQLSAAPAQVVSIAVVTPEINKEAPGCAAREDSDNGSSSVCWQAGPEDIKSHDVSASSQGSDPTGLSPSGEEQQPSNSVRESETTALADAMESLESEQNRDGATDRSATSLNEVSSSENISQDTEEDTALKVQDKNGDVPKAKEEERMETDTQAGKNTETQEVTEKEEQPAGCTATDVTVDAALVTEKEESVDCHLSNSEEDLYRGEEELSQNNKSGQQSVFETTCLKVEDRCSLAPAVNILSYSEREWKGNTAKSALIRKGYKEMAQRFSSLRRVRGDNYCALRATLFQVLSHSTHLPVCLQREDTAMLPKPLEAQEALISQWTFPGKCLQGDGTGDVTRQLTGYMELLRNKWQAAVDCPSDVERQQLCERVFQGGEEELGLLEALKLLMLARAVELHSCMQEGGDAPLFCWLLFARDSSDCPRSFLSNHLRHVGLTAGLEQVEMFLLGYALECTIQVYRLYKADTEEFVTYYPDDHKDDWPSVSLVTEDDRHYNVPVVEAAELHMELYSS